MTRCPYCGYSLPRRALRAEVSHGRKAIPWYRPINPTYACSSCGKSLRRAYHPFAWIGIALVFALAVGVRVYVAPWLVASFALTDIWADLVTHDLAVVLLFPAFFVILHVSSHFIPATRD